MLSGSVRAAIVLTLLAGLTGCAADRKQRVAERKLHEAMEEYARANPHLIVRRVQWHTPIAVRRRSVARPPSAVFSIAATACLSQWATSAAD
jgi:hypothetical protein